VISRYQFDQFRRTPLPQYPAAALTWIEVLTIADGARRTVIADGYAPAWSPDGTQIAYLKEPPGDHPMSAEAWVAAADGTGARRVATSKIPPTWSPDGTLLVALGEQGLFTVRPDGTHPTSLSPRMQSNQHLVGEPIGVFPYVYPAAAYRGAFGDLSPAWQRLPRE
jgi:Tol biopolymer transport system component